MVTVHRQYPAKRVTGHGVNSNTLDKINGVQSEEQNKQKSATAVIHIKETTSGTAVWEDVTEGSYYVYELDEE